MNKKFGEDLRRDHRAVRELDRAELAGTEGGVMPMWDADGNMITCTDYPRPLGSPPVSSVPPWLRQF